MITKIKADRHFLFDPASNYMMRVKIEGDPSVIDLKRAIVVSVRKHDILNCRILMDSDGEAYYVPRECDYIPEIEVVNGKLESEEIINNQLRREFDVQEGELIRFVIAKEDLETELVVIIHHIAGDGKSLLLLIQDIMTELDTPQAYVEEKKNRVVSVFDDKYDSQFVTLNDLTQAAIDETNRKWNAQNKIFTFEDRTRVFNQFWCDRELNVDSFELNCEELKGILHICKEHGVTLNNLLITLINKSLVHSARMAVVADVREKGNNTMGNYVELFMMEECYNQKQDIWENATYINRLAKKQLQDRKELLVGNLIRNRIDKGLHDAVFDHEYKSKVVDDYNEAFYVGKEGLPIMLSNIGVAPIKDDYGKYKIEKITFVSPVCNDATCNIAIITINNTFVMNMLTFKNDDRYERICQDVKADVLDLIGTKCNEEERKRVLV